ncbi:Sugar or nucleoside kinase, ribokinase family [Singulisphaera sp. GP187]|uniref:PfkB family carbohydrate kinase n=1 Tax=Singulisphaera sp. GP187 TaxID=1882752 RepID=UPI000929D832|nr:PfkB family carbohydrate kinase [Singulisphaera sp. GP187]SIN99210.1 Sugar or nucleoside kinase, ribokinase family [Singulisphaera sp. GP187]
MPLLVVGSIALDSVETPHGIVNDALGGAAVFFSYAASYFTPVRLVGVVGEDFPTAHREMLEGRKVDTSGLVVEKNGSTFRWRGKYTGDMSTAETLEVHLNVLGTFNPELSPHFADSPFVFLANGSPAMQRKVLSQTKKRQLVVADTMNFWIETQRDELNALLKEVDGLVINDGEARMLTDEINLVRAGRKVLELGPKFVIIKKGEHGAMFLSAEESFVMPAFPLADVVDPTGAGDSFAGGFMGYLASVGKSDLASLKTAMACGTVIASFNVEDFSLRRFQRTERDEVDRRLESYRNMMSF